MCGIVGFINTLETITSDSRVLIQNMTETLHHRGPDDSGVWLDDSRQVALGHRRLSILDLSPAGHQPMISSCGRYVIVLNGEIYNHTDLRAELERAGEIPQHGWRGHSDTEILLEYIRIWGVGKALQAAVGMFAFAVWDKQEKSLTLARDRMGEKPLYYGWQNGAFLFASELKAMKCHSSFYERIDFKAANLFFHFGYVPAPHSIYENIFKLTPGSFLVLNQSDISLCILPEPMRYWSLEEIALRGGEKPFQGNFVEARDELERLLLSAVKLQSIADVPVGAFLSGGIDSSLVVSMMQSATSSQVTTFSIGMPEERLNEAHFARAVAKHLGTNHVEHTIQPEEALNIIPKIPQIWDEPFADSSQIPTHLVCQLAKNKVTVALSGDGADEFFMGYPQYSFFKKIWKTRGLRHLPWESGFKLLDPFLNSKKGQLFQRRALGIVQAWHQPDGQALASYWMDKFRQVDPPFADKYGRPDERGLPLLPDIAQTVGLWDVAYYLADDILTKVDRAAMNVSLETRAPFLDHRIAEFALSLPLSYRLEGDANKKILREILYRYVPKSLVDRPKMGFSIPVSSWLKKELRPWAEDLFNDREALEAVGLEPGGVKKMWQEHLGGDRDHTDRMWIILSMLGYFKK